MFQDQIHLIQRRAIRPLICFLFIYLNLLVVAPTQAQVYTGSITGSIQDPSGAVVPNASVVLTDIDKGLKYSATTDTSGRYVLRALPPSKYGIRVAAAGFRSEIGRASCRERV